VQELAVLHRKGLPVFTEPTETVLAFVAPLLASRVSTKIAHRRDANLSLLLRAPEGETG
jgi:hypothetical protein